MTEPLTIYFSAIVCLGTNYTHLPLLLLLPGMPSYLADWRLRPVIGHLTQVGVAQPDTWRIPVQLITIRKRHARASNSQRVSVTLTDL